MTDFPKKNRNQRKKIDEAQLVINEKQLIAYGEPIIGKRDREDKENISLIIGSNKRPVLANRNYLEKVDSNQINEIKRLYEYYNYIKAKKQKSSLFGFLVYSAYLSQISFKEDEEHILSTAYMEKLGNEKENEHVQVRIFWNLFRDAMIDHKYTTFILYLDKFIQEWGWAELKEEVMFDKKLSKAFSSISLLQYNVNLPDVVRIISKTIKLDLLVKNDILLSGIIDTSSLHQNIVTELKLANKWEEVNEKPINEALPNGILEFIYEYIQREEKHQIPVEVYESINFELFNASRHLVSCLLQIRKKRMYLRSDKVLESTYDHDIMDPIEKFLLWDLYELSHQWDSNISKATKERNGTIVGPNKKPDIHVFYNGKILDWEILFGEVSYGLGKSGIAELIHINEDHQKLMKYCKDSWDKMYRCAFKMAGNLTDYMEIENIAIHSYNSIIEFYIIDQKYLPLHRSRLINRLKIPYNDLDNATFYKSIVDIMKTLFCIKNVMKKNLETIKKIENLPFKLSSDLEKTVNILKTYDSD